MRAPHPVRLPRAVVFDMDGLMLDTERVARRCWSQAASTIGVAFDTELLPSMIGRNSRDSRQCVLAHYGADYPVDVWMMYGGGYTDLAPGGTWNETYEHCFGPSPSEGYADISTACSNFRLKIHCL